MLVPLEMEKKSEAFEELTEIHGYPEHDLDFKMDSDICYFLVI